MPGLGSQLYWNHRRVVALRTLAKIATSNSTHGVFLNWQKAVSLKPDLHKILNNLPTNRLSKAWGRQKKLDKGLCYRAKCNNKRDSVAKYCKSCREKAVGETMRLRNNRLYGYNMGDCREILFKEFDKLSKDKLYEILFEALINIDYKRKEKLLSKTLLNKLRKNKDFVGYEKDR